MAIPAGMEVCYKCGGDGGEVGSNFGDCGIHPCFKCGTSGYLPAGTLERDEKMAAEMAKTERRPFYNFGD